jgi:hypothetical protein
MVDLNHDKIFTPSFNKITPKQFREAMESLRHYYSNIPATLYIRSWEYPLIKKYWDHRYYYGERIVQGL